MHTEVEKRPAGTCTSGSYLKRKCRFGCDDVLVVSLFAGHLAASVERILSFQEKVLAKSVSRASCQPGRDSRESAEEVFAPGPVSSDRVAAVTGYHLAPACRGIQPRCEM